jgi:hypothetical protein
VAATVVDTTPPTQAASKSDVGRAPQRRRWLPSWGVVATLVLSIAAMAQALRVWEWRPGTPLGFDGDAPWAAALVQGYMDYGPYSDNLRFGAPLGLNPGWSSTGNDIHVWVLTALGHLTGDPFTAMSLYFFLTFPLSALTMYWLCRRYGASPSASVVVGVLFSVIPGHQERFPHLFLAAYWAVPFAAFLVIETALGRSVLRVSKDSGRAATRRRQLAVMMMLFSIGLGDVYYVAFTLVLAACVIVVRQVRRLDVSELARLIAPMGVMALPAVVSILAARHRADRDLLTGNLPWGRSFVDSARWSGQIIDLVLPWPGHRLPSLALWAQGYDAITQTQGEISSLGFVALFGVVGVLTFVAGALLRGLGLRTPQLAAMAVVAVAAGLFYTRGGLGGLTALVLTPQIRTWSRLFIFIALIGLLGVALFLTWLASRGTSRVVALTTAGLVLLLGVLDQTNPARAPDYASNASRFEALEGFTSRIASNVGSGCDVFELPVIGFPEVNDDRWSDHMMLGLAGPAFRWSFGAIRGTERGDWQAALSTTDASRLADDLAAVGYCAVVTDREPGPDESRSEVSIATELGEPIASSSDGRYTAYSLADRRSALEGQIGSEGLRARASSVLHPVVLGLNGVWVRDGLSGRRYPMGPSPSVNVANLSGHPERVTLTVDLFGPADRSARVSLEARGATSADVALPAGGRESVTLTFEAPPGRSTVAIRQAGLTDWDALANQATLPSVLSVTATAQDPTVNVGVDLPTSS